MGAQRFYHEAGRTPKKMIDRKQTKEELVKELAALRRRIARLEASELKFRRSEEALRQSEARFRDLFDEAPVGYHEIDREGCITRINTTELAMLGYSAQEMVGRHVWEFVRERDKSRKAVAAKLAEKQPVGTFERSYRRKDGTYVPVLIQERLLRDGDGKVVGMRSIIQDVSRLREAQKALAEEKERLAVTLRSIGDGVITTDIEGCIVLLNKVAERLTGWTQEEAQGRPLREVFHIMNEKTGQRCENPVDKILASGEIIELANHTVLIARDGTERILADSGAPIRDLDSKIIGVVLVFRDITEKKKLEEELLRTEKLESVGILAGGIAHDFNNILTVILGNIALAKMRVDPGEELSQILSESQQAGLQAKSLTQQLLTFAKGGAPVRGVISVKQLLTDTAIFALRGSNVRCEFSIADELWPAEIDSGQISQVINNLLINATQAMPEGGIVNVSAENLSVPPRGSKESPPLPNGHYLKVSIQDQGIGIPKEHLGKIFDPYFTTKRKGSGLGLTTSHSIVKNHNGYVTVESQLGVGSTFHIFLPSCPDRAPRTDATVPAALSSRGKVLIMDDEERVRNVALRILQRLGYDVSVASEGAATVELYRQARESGSPFDAVILDLTVPGGLGGKETILRLKEVDPNVKAIVSSGYSTDPVMADYRSFGFAGLIAKPYQLEELSEVMYKVVAPR